MIVFGLSSGQQDTSERLEKQTEQYINEQHPWESQLHFHLSSLLPILSLSLCLSRPLPFLLWNDDSQVGVALVVEEDGLFW